MPPVLERHTSAAHHDAGAETHVVGLNIRDHIPLPVGTAQIDGAALGRDGVGVDLGGLAHLSGPLGAVGGAGAAGGSPAPCSRGR